MQLQNNHWCKLKSTQISYLHWIINLQIFKNLLLNLILSHHQLQQTLKKYLMLLSLNWLIYSVTQSSKRDSILKVLAILWITEYIQVCQLEKDDHETTCSIWIHMRFWTNISKTKLCYLMIFTCYLNWKFLHQICIQISNNFDQQ